jgi:hypothetical protein
MLPLPTGSKGPASRNRGGLAFALSDVRPGENPDEDSSDQRPDDGSEPDTLDVDAFNDGSEQDAQEQTERRLPRMASCPIIGP